MEKQRVNDAVIRLGNLIGKGRTHIVHRLSSKIRDLRKKDEKKFNQRIQRLLREIAFLKTLTNSRSRKLISRRILLSEENHAAIIEAESTEPDDRAFHRLCKEKCIAEYVLKFREDNIDWKYWVPPLLEMWQKKLDLKEQRSNKNQTDKNDRKRPSIKELVGEKPAKRKRTQESDSSNAEDSASDNQNELMSRNEIHDEDEEKQMKKRKGPLAKRRFLVAANEMNVDSDDMSEDEHDSVIHTNNKEETDESEEDEEEASTDDADEEVVFNRKDIEDHDDEPEEDTESSAGEQAENSESAEDRKPFRPYAPKHVDTSDTEDESGEDSEDDLDLKIEDSDMDVSEKDRENEFQNESDDNEDESEDEEVSDEEDEEFEEDHSDEESDEDSENEAEIARKRKLLLGGTAKKKPEELEIDFSVQNKLNCVTKDLDDPVIREKVAEKKKQNKMMKPSKVNSGEESEEPSSENESDEEDSFFVREGEIAKEIPSKTIPKEKAPGLNRRERRTEFATTKSTDHGYDHAAGDHGTGRFRERSGYEGGRASRGSDSFNVEGRPSNRFDQRGGFRGRGENRRGRGGFGRGRSNYNEGNSREFHGNFNEDRFARNGQHGQRSSFGGFNRNSRTDFAQRKSFGGRENEGRGEAFRDTQRGRGWTPRRGGGHNNDRFNERSQRGGQTSFKNEGNTPRGTDRQMNRATTGRDASFQNQRQNGDRQASGGRGGESGEELHPSWAAKKRLSASINQPFQGKKIVFSED